MFRPSDLAVHQRSPQQVIHKNIGLLKILRHGDRNVLRSGGRKDCFQAVFWYATTLSQIGDVFSFLVMQFAVNSQDARQCAVSSSGSFRKRSPSSRSTVSRSAVLRPAFSVPEQLFLFVFDTVGIHHVAWADAFQHPVAGTVVQRRPAKATGLGCTYVNRSTAAAATE